MSYTTTFECVDFMCIDCGRTAVYGIAKYSETFYDLKKRDEKGELRCDRCQRKHDTDQSERNEAEEARKREYDQWVMSRPTIWANAGCSCHIDPPCDYCTKQGEEE